MAISQHSSVDFLGVSRIQNLPDAASAQEPVTLAQLNAAIENIAWKDDVVVRTSSNINLAAPGATLDGVTMSASQRFLADGQTTASEKGIYIWNGSAVPATRAPDMSVSAEFNSAIVPVKTGTSAGTQWRQTAVDPTVGTTAIVFTPFLSSSPSASETTSGIAEIATQAETDAGTDDLRMVTPLKLASSSNRKLKFEADIGDGSATQYDVTHNFNTRAVRVTVYRNSGNFDDIGVDVGRPTVNSVRITFGTAPTTNQFHVVVLG
jgi:hypothetical protein